MQYFNLADCLNADCIFNFITGNRSSGKSFALKRHLVKSYRERGKRFVYIRRTLENLKQAAPEFYTDIKYKFPASCDMKYKAGRFYWTEDKDAEEVEWEVCGYAFQIGGMHNVKSTPLENIGNILFDEFIPDDLRYSHPGDIFFEPRALLSIYMTVARGYKKVIDEGVRVYCLSNMVTRFNPYYTYFGVNLTGKLRHRDLKRSVYAVIDLNRTISEEIKNSKVGALLSETDYGAYALENEALQDDARHVLKKVNPKAYPIFSLFCNGEWYTACIDDVNLVFRQMFDPSLPRRYRMGIGGDENIPWIDKYTSDWIRRFYQLDQVYYDCQKTKNMVGGPFEGKFNK